eukprot:Nk52_evm10s2415 gene=Nk52_evmTU10s2415
MISKIYVLILLLPCIAVWQSSVSAIPVLPPEATSNSPLITIFTSGSSRDFGTFQTTQKALSQAAFMVYSSLPSDRSKTNLSWVADNLNFYSPNFPNCTSSAFESSCLHLYSFALLTADDSMVFRDEKTQEVLFVDIPFTWTTFTAFLAYKGIATINHFSKYGCVNDITISLEGRDLDTLQGTSICPPVEDELQSGPLKSDNGGRTNENVSCFSVPYGDRFTGKCFMATFVPEIAPALVTVAGKTIQYYRAKKAMETEKATLLENIQSLEGRMERERDYMVEAEGLLQRKIREVDQRRTAIERSEEGLHRIERIHGRDYGIMEYRRDGGYFEILDKRVKIEKGVKSMRKKARDLRYLEKEYQSNLELVGDFYGEIQRLQSLRQHQGYYTYQEFVDARGELQLTTLECFRSEFENHMDRYADQYIFHCERAYRELYALYVKNPFIMLNLETFENAKESILLESQCDLRDRVSNDMAAEEQVEQQTVRSGSGFSKSTATVETEAEAFGEKELGGATVKEGEEAAMSLGKTVMGGLMGFLGFGMEIWNMNMNIGMIQDSIDGAVRQINNYANVRFNHTIDLINQVSQQSYRYYQAESNEITEKLHSLEQSVSCKNAWDEFREKLSVVQTHYDRFSTALNCSRRFDNITDPSGHMYLQCEYDQVAPSGVPVVVKDFETFRLVANMDGFSWDQSVVGEFAQECARYSVVSEKMTGWDLGSLLTRYHDMIRNSIYRSGMLMKWASQVSTGYQFLKFNGSSYVDYSAQYNESKYIMVNQTGDFTCWFRDQIVPPAMAPFVPSSWWTDFGLSPPSSSYFNVEILDPLDFKSKGPLAPLVWEPFVENPQLERISDAEHFIGTMDLSTSREEMKSLTQEEILFGRTRRNVKDISSSSSSPNMEPPASYLLKLNGTSNVTDSVLTYCTTLPCFHQTCQCTGTLIAPCTCYEQNQCDCNVFISFNRTSAYPARGWAGAYNSSDANGYRPAGKQLCSSKDVSADVDCIPGVGITPPEATGSRILLFADMFTKMLIPSVDNEEFKTTLKDETKIPNNSNLLFQMYEAQWAWKYGNSVTKDYLEKYFAEVPYYLESIYTWNNASKLVDDENQEWRNYWMLTFQRGPNEDLTQIPIRVTHTETQVNSEATFVFDCPSKWSKDYDKSKCKLDLIYNPYPRILSQ